MPHHAQQPGARHLAASLFAVAALFAAACRSDAPVRIASKQVAIGVGALPGHPGYESVLRGLDLAVERLNESGSMRFHVRRPDRGSTSAVQVAQQLRDDPSVIGVVGHPESGNTIEAVPVYADVEHGGRNAVVAISPTASSPRLSGISPWFFRVAPSDDEAARYVARWVRDSLGGRRAAVVYRNDSYGRDWSSTFTDSFEKAGATVVSHSPYLSGITEWDAYAQLLARLKPDVLLFPGDADDAVEMLRALRTAGVSLTFIGGDGTEGMRDSSVAQGAHYVAFFHHDRIVTEEGRTFARRYTEKYHQQPDMFAAMSYDAALAIGRSVITGARTRADLRLALERLGRNGTPAVEGAAGRIAFATNHDIAGRSVVITTIGALRGAD
jgi:branched-chain amino acid transport system substrate-binding protein